MRSEMPKPSDCMNLGRKNSILAPIVVVWMVLEIFSGAIEAALLTSESYIVLSADETRFLYMRGVGPPRKPWKEWTIGSQDKIINEETLLGSGVYEVKDLQRIHRVDRYVRDEDLEVSPDLRYFCMVNRFGMESREAVTFYKMGVRQRTYECSDLLRLLSHRVFFRFSPSGYREWIMSLDSGASTVRIYTSTRFVCGVPINYHEMYELDFASGEILNTSYRLFGITLSSVLALYGIVWSIVVVAIVSGGVLCYHLGRWVTRRLMEKI